MFCPTCGAQLKDGAKFCPKCGTAISGVVVAAAPAGTQSAPAPASVPAPKRRRAPLVVGIVAAVAVLLGGGVFLWRMVAGGGPSAEEIAMANAALGYGTSASANGYDYYWDVDAAALMRVKSGDSSAMPEAIVQQRDDYGFIHDICAEGNYVFFVMGGYSDDSQMEVYRANSDGSDLRVIYTPGADEGVSWGSPVSQLSVLDHKLYAVVDSTRDNRSSLEVWRMDLDGSNRERMARFDPQTVGYVVPGKDTVYYSDGSSVYSQRYDEESSTKIYQSSWEYLSQPIPYAGRLYVLEHDSSDRSRLMSMNLDGSDQKAVCDVTGWEGWASWLGLADGHAYFSVNDDMGLRVMRVELSGDGSMKKVVDVEPDNGQPALTNEGDHLVMCVRSPDSIGAAYGAYRLSFDGTQVTTYLAYPYDE